MFQALLTLTRPVGFGLLLALLLLLLLPLALVHKLKAVVMHAMWQRRHGQHGRRWLAVYSDGKRWKDHFETVVLPLLGSAAHAVNTSHDSRWNRSYSLERQIHRHWGGRDDHTPILIYLPKHFGSACQVRFYQAYLIRSRNGQEKPLEQQVERVQRLLNEA